MSIDLLIALGILISGVVIAVIFALNSSSAFATAGLVAAGGALGAVARYAIAQWIVSPNWPLNYLIINVSGALLIGMLMTLAGEFSVISSRTRIFLGVGVLGGYTTFSTYMLGIFQMIAAGHWLNAYAYAVGSLILGLLATWSGMIAIRALFMSRHSAHKGESSK
ncbi:MAG: CrcB family protein [Firmicutes bacterium]|nr:CrcB family protein [Bacillota bacterium]